MASWLDQKRFLDGTFHQVEAPGATCLADLERVASTQDEEDAAASGRTLPACPTNAVPGTEEKLAVLIQRQEDNEHLHHPDDLRLVGEGAVGLDETIPLVRLLCQPNGGVRRRGRYRKSLSRDGG